MRKKQKIILLIFLILLSFFQVLPVIRNGLKYSYGVGFWGSNGHDAVWHLSLINNIKNPISIEMPIFSGEKLHNYHPFFDILISTLSRITHISSSIWLFQIVPIITSFFTVSLSFIIGRKLTNKFSGGIYLAFLNTFANSLGWIISLIKDGHLAGESTFWAMQSISNQLNPPYALSILFILIILYIIIQKEKLSLKNSILLIILLSLLPITKAYGGVVMLFFFGIYSLYALKKRYFIPLIILIISATVGFSVYSIFNTSTGGLFIFKPLWFTNTLFEATDRLYIGRITNLRYALESTGQIGPKLLLIYIFGIIVFIVGNFSWRLLGFLSLRKIINNFYLQLFITIIFTIILPLLFIQKGTSWNTIQFLYYGLFFSNFLLAQYLVNIEKIKLGKTIIAIILITSFISNFDSIKTFLSNPAHAYISNNELDGLNHLKSLPQGNVLTFPYNKYLKTNKSTPIPLYMYETTGYVSAYSQKPTFMEDEMNLDITGYNWQNRLSDETKFFTTDDKYFARGFLLNNNIGYIYLVDNQNFKLSPFDLQIDKIYENSQIRVYKVRK